MMVQPYDFNENMRQIEAFCMSYREESVLQIPQIEAAYNAGRQKNWTFILKLISDAYLCSKDSEDSGKRLWVRLSDDRNTQNKSLHEAILDTAKENKMDISGYQEIHAKLAELSSPSKAHDAGAGLVDEDEEEAFTTNKNLALALLTQNIQDCKEQLSLMQSVHNLKVKDKPDLPLAASPLPAKSETLTALKKAIKDLEEFKTKLQKASGEKAFQALTAPKKSGDKSGIKSCTKQFTDIAGEIVTNNAAICKEIVERHKATVNALQLDGQAIVDGITAGTKGDLLKKAVEDNHLEFAAHLKKCADASWAQPSLKARKLMTENKTKESVSIEFMILEKIVAYNNAMKMAVADTQPFALASTLSFQEFDLRPEDVAKLLKPSQFASSEAITGSTSSSSIKTASKPEGAITPENMLQELQRRQAANRSSFKRLFNKLCAAISCFLVSARCLVGLSTKDSKHRNAVIGSESRAVLLSRKADYFTQTPEARKAAEEAAKAAKTKKK